MEDGHRGSEEADVLLLPLRVIYFVGYAAVCLHLLARDHEFNHPDFSSFVMPSVKDHRQPLLLSPLFLSPATVATAVNHRRRSSEIERLGAAFGYGREMCECGIEFLMLVLVYTFFFRVRLSPSSPSSFLRPLQSPPTTITAGTVGRGVKGVVVLILKGVGGVLVRFS